MVGVIIGPIGANPMLDPGMNPFGGSLGMVHYQLTILMVYYEYRKTTTFRLKCSHVPRGAL
jgi:hypothetical protein